MTDHRKKQLTTVGGAVSILVIGLLIAYVITLQSRVSIDTASVEAPLISLAPSVPGRLDAVYVHPGDVVTANEPLAEVGTQTLTSKVAGLIVSVTNTVGAQVSPSAPVVTMIDPSALRVVGRIDETKGLAKIHVGDPVTFTVDAFGSREFTGVVDEVAPTSNASGIVFNISDQRETQQFDIKARFDTSAFPELKNGMSARLTVYPR